MNRLECIISAYCNITDERHLEPMVVFKYIAQPIDSTFPDLTNER
jgi:hypothetical protein